jgi:hypothetical protein
MVQRVAPLPNLHGKAARVGVAHGHTPQVLSGPDGEHRRDRHGWLARIVADDFLGGTKKVPVKATNTQIQ